MVFYGEYDVSLTAGGRIVLPKKIRALLHGSECVLTKDHNQVIRGYDTEDWHMRAATISHVSLLDDGDIQARRMLFASTQILEIDEQGRIVLPKHVVDYASLVDTVKILGVGDHFEIWNKKSWDKYTEKN